QTVQAQVIRQGLVVSNFDINQSVISQGNTFNRNIQNNLNLVQILKEEKYERYMILSLPERTIILPRPIFNDAEVANNIVNLKKSQNNQIYTTIKSTDTKNLKLAFQLGRQKSLELYSFIISISGRIIKMVDWKGKIRNV